MTRSPVERLMVWLWSRAWCGRRGGTPPSEDLVLFIGEPEDVADRRFGFGLPNRRDYARRYYQFVGYVFGFDPEAYADTARVRAALGYDQRPLVVCSVAGTAVGADLLRLCAEAFPHLRQRVPDARMVLVCGPRVDPAALRPPPGVEVRGYLPRLYEHLAACDVAVVQGGGTTTLELTALRGPSCTSLWRATSSLWRATSSSRARWRSGSPGTGRASDSTTPGPRRARWLRRWPGRLAAR